MNPLDDFLNHERRRTPPPAITHDFERRVLAGLAADRRRRIRNRTLLAAAGLGLGALLLLPGPRERAVESAPDFSESVVILSDHTCIWLEPVTVEARR